MTGLDDLKQKVLEVDLSVNNPKVQSIVESEIEAVVKEYQRQEEIRKEMEKRLPDFLEVVLEEKNKKEAQDLAKKLLLESFTLTREATAEDKLYGSIDAQEIEKLLKSEEYDINRKNILLTEPIKSLGAYSVDLKLHPEVTATIKVWIVRK